MNTIDEIKKLIDIYFEGETTLTQEEELRVFFSSNNIPDELKQYQAIFGYFTGERNALQNKETNNSESVLPEIRPKRNKALWYTLVGVAAGLLLLLTITLKWQTKPNEVLCEGSFVIINGKCSDDPRLVSKYAIDAIDAIMLPAAEAAEDMNTLINDNSDIISEHIRILNQLN